VATVEKRTRDGKTSYRVRYRDPAGRQKSKSFARKVDAERWMASNEVAKTKGAWVDPALGKVTFGEWAERWYATTAGLRPSTRDNYRRQLDAYLLPHFARAPLTSIDALAVREWQAKMASDGLGAISVRTVRAVLHLVLASARVACDMPTARAVRARDFRSWVGSTCAESAPVAMARPCSSRSLVEGGRLNRNPPDRSPIVEASASIIQGSESMFARVEVDTGIHGRERHACHFVIIGRRADVLAVLDQLRHAVVAAPVPIAGEDGEAR